MTAICRFTFNTQSVALLLWAARRFSRLPDRELYRVRSPWSRLLRASQVASLGVLLSGVRIMGILPFAGLTSVGDLLAGRDVRPAPEAQGSPVGSDDEMVRAGHSASVAIQATSVPWDFSCSHLA